MKYVMNAQPMLPTPEDVIKRIDDMPSKKEKDEKYRNAFRYLYLIAGWVSQIAGDYEPKGSDATLVNIDGVKAVMFPVKTARREGRIRPVAIPINPYYEPWAESLYVWFKRNEDENPFGGLSMRSYQRQASIVFDGLEWPIEKYSKTIYGEVDETKIIRIRNNDGIKEYLVEYDDGERHWVQNPLTKRETVVEEKHWNPFSLTSLRHLRIFELKYFYEFSKGDIETFTGLSGMAIKNSYPSALNRYQFVEPSNGKLHLEHLKFQASSYFRKLLKSRKYEG